MNSYVMCLEKVGTLVLKISPPRHWGRLLGLPPIMVVATGICIAGMIGVFPFWTWDAPDVVFIVKYLVCLLCGIGGGVIAVLLSRDWCWNTFGHEVIEGTNKGLTVNKALGRFRWSRTIHTSDIQGFQVVANEIIHVALGGGRYGPTSPDAPTIAWPVGLAFSKDAGRIGVEYGQEVYFFGYNLDESDAQEIVRKLSYFFDLL